MLTAAMLIGGCQSNELAPESSAATTVAAPNGSGLPELVRYGSRVRRIAAEELAEQYRALAFESTPWSDEAAIRLSLLLSAPGTPYHDVDRATRILREVVEDRPLWTDEHADFAALLHHLLSEQAYAASEDDALANLLSEARDQNEELTEELAAMRAELDAERERRETLQEQLDALKRLEEQLSLEVFESP